jgi:hypothetical protein
MMLRNLSRAAIGGSLKLIRLPIDGLLAVGGDRPSFVSAELALDRADARTRDLAGLLLWDFELREDAELRREAADERERALKLRAEAELRSQRADQAADEQRHAAQQRRKNAAETKQRKRQQAQERRRSAKASAAQRTNQRRKAAEATAAKTDKVIEEREKNSSLEQLGSKEQAVREKEAALAARDESRRLKQAAGATKEKRKSGD